MVKYHVTVCTASRIGSTTMNNIFIKLMGTDGESERKLLKNLKGPLAFVKGTTTTFTVSCPTSIGKLVLIELDKKSLPLFPEDSWFPAKVEVKSPEGDVYHFPIYSWITDSTVHRFREGTALRNFEDDFPLGKYSREKELEQRREDYQWDVFCDGLPHCLKADDPYSLPHEVRYSFTKRAEFLFSEVTGMTELQLKGLANSKKSWTDFEDIDRVFFHRETELSGPMRWKYGRDFGRPEES